VGFGKRIDELMARLLDALASRAGVTLVAGFFVVLAATSIGYVDRASNLLVEAQKIVESPSIRNGAVSVSDLNRATAIANEFGAHG